MPSTLLMKTLSGMHRAALKLSGGRLGAALGGNPSLELTTTGRRTGKPRVSMLTSPVQVGDALVVVASRGGDDFDPAWFLNLRDDPHVQVALAGGPRRPMVARIAEPDERERLWPQITAALSNYAEYQSRTSRVIPVVLLEPAA